MGRGDLLQPLDYISPQACHDLINQSSFEGSLVYPERRECKGPNIIRNTLERVYCISLLKMIEELKIIKDQREQKKQASKKRRPTGKNGGTKCNKKPRSNRTFQDDRDPNDPDEENAPLDLPLKMIETPMSQMVGILPPLQTMTKVSWLRSPTICLSLDVIII